jgi:hypothetical protein
MVRLPFGHGQTGSDSPPLGRGRVSQLVATMCVYGFLSVAISAIMTACFYIHARVPNIAGPISLTVVLSMVFRCSVTALVAATMDGGADITKATHWSVGILSLAFAVAPSVRPNIAAALAGSSKRLDILRQVLDVLVFFDAQLWRKLRNDMSRELIFATKETRKHTPTVTDELFVDSIQEIAAHVEFARKGGSVAFGMPKYDESYQNPVTLASEVPPSHPQRIELLINTFGLRKVEMMARSKKGWIESRRQFARRLLVPPLTGEIRVGAVSTTCEVNDFSEDGAALRVNGGATLASLNVVDGRSINLCLAQSTIIGTVIWHRDRSLGIQFGPATTLAQNQMAIALPRRTEQ